MSRAQTSKKRAAGSSGAPQKRRARSTRKTVRFDPRDASPTLVAEPCLPPAPPPSEAGDAASDDTGTPPQVAPADQEDDGSRAQDIRDIFQLARGFFEHAYNDLDGPQDAVSHPPAPGAQDSTAQPEKFRNTAQNFTFSLSASGGVPARSSEALLAPSELPAAPLSLPLNPASVVLNLFFAPTSIHDM